MTTPAITDTAPAQDPLRDDLIHSSEVPTEYPNLFTPGSWAWAVRHRARNGLAPAFIRVHNRLFVSRKALAECLLKQREEATEEAIG